jgi:integrase
MDRKAEVWRLRWKRPNVPGVGTAHVIWMSEGRPVERSLKTRDPEEAARRAVEEYARWLAKERKGREDERLGAFDELVTDWIHDVKPSRSADRIDNYLGHGRKWLKFFASFEASTDARQIADFQRARLRSAIGSTVRDEVGSLRLFHKWAMDERRLISELPEYPKPPKKRDGVRTSTRKSKAINLTDDQIRAILAKLPEWSMGADSKFHRTRRYRVLDWCIVAAGTGLRPTTISRLEPYRHFRPGELELHITADIDKARFERDIPITHAVASALERSMQHAKGGTIFGTHHYHRDFRRAVKAAGFDPYLVKHVSPYDMRHFFITNTLELSGNLPGTAHLAGHKQVSTTNIYAHPSKRAAVDALAATTSATGKGRGQKRKSEGYQGVATHKRTIESRWPERANAVKQASPEWWPHQDGAETALIGPESVATKDRILSLLRADDEAYELLSTERGDVETVDRAQHDVDVRAALDRCVRFARKGKRKECRAEMRRTLTLLGWVDLENSRS